MPPNEKTLSAGPPFVYMQPHIRDAMPPILFVGNVKVVIDNPGRAEQWARILLDYRLSLPLRGAK